MFRLCREIEVPLDVVIVSTDRDGFINREELRVEAVFNRPLRTSLEAATPMLRGKEKEGRDGGVEGASKMICYEGMHHVCWKRFSSRTIHLHLCWSFWYMQGREIDLSECPMNVDYISSRLSRDMIPLLFICDR